MRLPLTSTRSRSFTSTPACVTTWPLTLTAPAAISSSARRREATPAWARYFWSRTCGSVFLPGLGLGDRGGGGIAYRFLRARVWGCQRGGSLGLGAGIRRRSLAVARGGGG